MTRWHGAKLSFDAGSTGEGAGERVFLNWKGCHLYLYVYHSVVVFNCLSRFDACRGDSQAPIWVNRPDQVLIREAKGAPFIPRDPCL